MKHVKETNSRLACGSRWGCLFGERRKVAARQLLIVRSIQAPCARQLTVISHTTTIRRATMTGVHSELQRNDWCRLPSRTRSGHGDDRMPTAYMAVNNPNTTDSVWCALYAVDEAGGTVSYGSATTTAAFVGKTYYSMTTPTQTGWYSILDIRCNLPYNAVVYSYNINKKRSVGCGEYR
jgi:hypothetical protein